MSPHNIEKTGRPQSPGQRIHDGHLRCGGEAKHRQGARGHSDGPERARRCLDRAMDLAEDGMGDAEPIPAAEGESQAHRGRCRALRRQWARMDSMFDRKIGNFTQGGRRGHEQRGDPGRGEAAA